MGLYFFNNPIIQLVTQSYTCHKKISFALHSRLLRSNWKFRGSRLNTLFSPRPNWGLSLSSDICGTSWDVVMTASISMPSVASRSVASGAAQRPQAELCLCIGTKAMLETNLWPGWRRRVVYEPFCYGSMRKDANLRKVRPWCLL